LQSFGQQLASRIWDFLGCGFHSPEQLRSNLRTPDLLAFGSQPAGAKREELIRLFDRDEDV
jgi:hypothetical protein